MNPLLFKDFYKTGHVFQYPKGTQMVYSNLTPRSSRIEGVDKIVVWGIQGFLHEMHDAFEDGFFKRDKEEVINEYRRRMDTSLGPNAIPTRHLERLHDFKRLPVEIKVLPEGTLCPLRVPVLTIKNTRPEFYWVTNFLETWLSCGTWMPMTSATIAFEYRKLLQHFADQTSDALDFVQWQGHDFSMRGHASLQSAIASGAAHLLSFTGTDTIPAIDYLERHYSANADRELIGGSVPATEHSVMCMGGAETERETFKRLLTEVYPSGIVSIVSDTWNLWSVLSQTLPALKQDIMARNGKLVIRPDSGDPVKIICGDPQAADRSCAKKGVIESLWDEFGGTINSKGFKQLDPHVGCIYGDSITLERARAICTNLREKGFASTNMVFGIGSYTYQYVTRDTFGFAVKSTYGVIDGKPVEIYKNPFTDDGVKRSATGLLRVNDDMTLSERVSAEDERGGMLRTVYHEGLFGHEQSFADVRSRLMKQL